MQYKLGRVAYYYSLGTFVSLSDGPVALLSADPRTSVFFSDYVSLRIFHVQYIVDQWNIVFDYCYLMLQESVA